MSAARGRDQQTDWRIARELALLSGLAKLQFQDPSEAKSVRVRHRGAAWKLHGGRRSTGTQSCVYPPSPAPGPRRAVDQGRLAMRDRRC